MFTEIELKEKLIAKINNTDDVELLKQISLIIDFEIEIKGVYKLNPQEEAAVKEGQDQINNGLFLSHTESNKRVDEWLKKYDGQ